MNKIIKKIKEAEKRLIEVHSELSKPATLQNSELCQQLGKELKKLESAININHRYNELLKEISGLEEVIKSDSEEALKEMAKKEAEELSSKKILLETQLKEALTPKKLDEGDEVIIEIRAGAGGNEAALFAGDLFRMYARYAESKGYKVEPFSGHPTGLGGFKEVIFSISGPNVYSNYKFESGVHRVQRVPVTEASGRIHTSTVTVAVLKEAGEVDIKIDNKNLRIDTYRASGAGGQHVNKTDSAVRITHLPTNLVVTCQDERSQTKNRAKAMKFLRAKLLQAEEERIAKEQKDKRKKQVGTGDRSEKIRTYNYPQNRVTDHRINFSVHNLPEVVNGSLDKLVDALKEAELKAQEDE